MDNERDFNTNASKVLRHRSVLQLDVVSQQCVRDHLYVLCSGEKSLIRSYYFIRIILYVASSTSPTIKNRNMKKLTILLLKYNSQYEIFGYTCNKNKQTYENR